MKKIIRSLSLILVAVLFTTLFACRSTEELNDTESQLVGKYQFSSLRVVENKSNSVVDFNNKQSWDALDMNYESIQNYVWNNRATKFTFYDNKIEGKLNGSFEKDGIRTDFQWFISERIPKTISFSNFNVPVSFGVVGMSRASYLNVKITSAQVSFSYSQNGYTTYFVLRPLVFWTDVLIHHKVLVMFHEFMLLHYI